MSKVSGPVVKRTGPGEIDELEPKPLEDNPVFNDNSLKLGVFATNVGSGALKSSVETSFEPSYAHNVKIAELVEQYGLEMFVPLGKWKGFGGQTDHGGQNLETYTWASAMSQHTDYPTIFSTSHVPTIHPLVAAKQSTTIDHVSQGRFGLNIVAGWFSPEMEMFGGGQLDHDERYDKAHEWAELLQTFWTEQGFEYDGEFYEVDKNPEVDEEMRGPHYVAGGYMRPKPIQQPRPPIMSAGQSDAGRNFAATHADLSFFSMTDLEQGKDFIDDMHDRVEDKGRDRDDIHIMCPGMCIIGETTAEAEKTHEEIVEHADWEGVWNTMDLIGIESESFDDPYNETAEAFVTGAGHRPLLGTPEEVAEQLIEVNDIGVEGWLLTFPDYVEGLRTFGEEVLPLLEAEGIRVERGGTDVDSL
jgi:alkanesulfonate monooxygenase SsuD/methylene tetrahydromethanopterin reductase-like flavin-dependent oxidoreductase (luciferase family)